MDAPEKPQRHLKHNSLIFLSPGLSQNTCASLRDLPNDFRISRQREEKLARGDDSSCTPDFYSALLCWSPLLHHTARAHMTGLLFIYFVNRAVSLAEYPSATTSLLPTCNHIMCKSASRFDNIVRRTISRDVGMIRWKSAIRDMRAQRSAGSITTEDIPCRLRRITDNSAYRKLHALTNMLLRKFPSQDMLSTPATWRCEKLSSAYYALTLVNKA